MITFLILYDGTNNIVTPMSRVTTLPGDCHGDLCMVILARWMASGAGRYILNSVCDQYVH